MRAASTNSHKSKTIAALLASLGGGLGLHRFYIAGRRDKWAWLHLITLPVSGAIYLTFHTLHPFFAFAPFILSVLSGFLACLIIGTTSDEKWDGQYNRHSLNRSDTGWTIAVILVLTLGCGAGALIAVIARTFDLLFTGGLYG